MVQKAIEALCSETPIFISQSQVRSHIVSVGLEYAPDNLPIDVDEYENLELDELPPNEQIFYEQLKIICLGSNRLRMAIRDYYRAFQQRANWVREELLYTNELDKYEKGSLMNGNIHFMQCRMTCRIMVIKLQKN